MNKQELVDLVHMHLSQSDAVKLRQLNRADIRELFECVFNTMKSELLSGNTVSIVGFGKFETRNRVERIGRNPQTGDSITIPVTRTLSFQASKRLKELIKKMN